MIGILMMLTVAVLAFYLLFFKTYPAMAFQYMGRGERKGRAEYQRIKREHPDAPEAQRSEAEYVEDFIRKGPKPWKYIFLMVGLLLVGMPLSCIVGLAGS